ncbi:MAG TPA: hypothetical protein VGP92_13205 [Acidimicrobiia bacterium]|jgi:hypothetical protein|nr:hypothetical protein [Acidimicrobiia bacterium]
MFTDPLQPFTLVFVGHATADSAARAGAYEDAVVTLYADHGAQLLYRGRRSDDQDPSLPFEVHVTWFPHRAALDAYLTDARRVALLDQFGEVFTSKQVVEMQTISGLST